MQLAKLLHSLGAVVTVNDSSPEKGNKEAAALRSEVYRLFAVVIQQVF